MVNHNRKEQEQCQRKEVYIICRKCGTVRVHCSSASLCVGCRSLSGIRLPSLRPFIYIGLYVVWAISFRKRIIQKEIRRCLTAIAAMMIFWMFIRMCKFEISDEMPTAWRYAWYFYYIPMLLIPTVSLYLAFYIRQPEGYKLPKKTMAAVSSCTFSDRNCINK